ncbi:MAG: histidine kinase [Bacteroidales bacterium]|jgi:sensor histidine kinase YesM|nr:histidine kinase [Bacteroidales bacterium]MDD3700090.1 histidine kinase [Bacteroidales bacterium]MDY0369086.1 histidine kinase [Bacteroidales bacterium]
MLHPILKNRQSLITYLGVWVAVTLLQILLMSYTQHLDWLICLTDALVFNGLFVLIGFSLWYVLRFYLIKQHLLFDRIINHLLSIVVTLAVWLLAGYFLLGYILSDQQDYLSWLTLTLPWRVLIGCFFYLIIILIYYMMLYYEDLQQKLKIEAELNSLVREAELNALKSQINPHFLFNSLNSISSLTITEPEKAQDMVIKLSDFMRYSLSHDRNETTNLRNELENAERYLEIEKVRFGTRLSYQIDVPDSCLDMIIPNMILQPLLENAVKHGVHHSTEEVLIRLSCNVTEAMIEISVTNTFDPAADRRRGEGIGLKNISRRLQLLYNRNDLLQIKSVHTKFEVILRIPKQAIA